MAGAQVLPPFPVFTDIDGNPIDDGYIYVGQEGLDPIASPVSVFWDRDLTVPATQPIRTIGGYPSNAGVRSVFYSSAPVYSILVRNKNGTAIYSDSSSLSSTDLESRLADSTDPSKGAGMVGFKGTTLYKALGSLELSVTISTLWPSQPAAALNEMIALCESQGGGVVMIPPGDYTLETTVIKARRVVVRGSGKNVTLLRWGQTGPAFKFQPISFLAGSHAIEDITLTNVTGAIIAGSVGFEISDTFGFGLRRISITNLDTDIRLRNRNFWTEGTIIDDFNMFHCNYGLTFARDPSPATGTDSFADTVIKNYATEASDNGFCMVLGDDSISTRLIRIYNCKIDAALWHKNGAAAVKWGTNTTINNSSGSVRSEGFTGASDLQPGLNGATNGLRQFDGEWITNDGGRTTKDQFMKRMDFRATKFRDMGQSGPGGFQSVAKWFKCVDLSQSKGNIGGTLTISGNFGSSRSYTGVANFYFGRGGATQRPAFSVTGDGFSGTGSGTPRLVWVRDDITLNESLWFYRPPFTNVAMFNYSYDSYLNGQVGTAGEGIGLNELWLESATPIGVPNTTVLFDSQGNYDAQQSYNGDEMLFAGQRTMMTANGDGVTTQFLFSHGLGVAPAYFSAVAVSTAACTAVIGQVFVTTNNVAVVFKVAPAAGTNNVIVAVECARKAFTIAGRPAT